MHSIALENADWSASQRMAAELPQRIAAERYAIEAQGLTKRYGQRRAVDAIDLAVPEGSFYLLAGPNGAGKSTAFRMLLGLQRPDAGRIRVGDHVSGPDGRVRAHIGHVPEAHALGYPTLRVETLVSIHSRYRPSWDVEYARALARQLEIPLRARAGKLSKGEARRVQLLMALAHRPAVLLLDEPTDGLDRIGRDLFQRLLLDHVTQSPTTVLVASHVAHELETLATDVGILRQGQLLTQLSRADLHTGLRCYEFTTPPAWTPPVEVRPGRREDSGTDHRWTVWGDEAGIVSALTAAAAVVRSVRPLTLDEATLALLTWEGA